MNEPTNEALREKALDIANRLHRLDSAENAGRAALIFAEIRTGDMLEAILIQLRDGGIRVSAT